MFLFIDSMVQVLLTGIESAQYKRLRMLKRFNMPAKIVMI